MSAIKDGRLPIVLDKERHLLFSLNVIDEMQDKFGGFDKLAESHTGIETHVADDAISCVAFGTGKSLDSLDQMQDGTMNLSRRKQMNY